MKTKIALLIMAVILVGCGDPRMHAEKANAKPVVKERNEVIARRATLEVELATARAKWKADCMREKLVTVAFESDIDGKCIRMADEIHPDVITQKLLSEFGGVLTEPVKEETPNAN